MPSVHLMNGSGGVLYDALRVSSDFSGNLKEMLDRRQGILNLGHVLLVFDEILSLFSLFLIVLGARV